MIFLHERFHTVRCTLWRKGDLHAPEMPDAAAPPAWSADATLTLSEHMGRVRLEWPPAAADAEVYGYMVLRSENGTW